MKRVRYVLFAACFIVISLAAGQHSRTVLAQEPLNITLASFDLSAVENGVLVEWSTGTESGTAGFKLKRGQNEDFAFLQDPSGSGDLFIPAIGGISTGADYSFVDETAVTGEAYTYELWEFAADSSLSKVGSKTISLVPTATPIPVGGVGASTTTNTPIPQATNTPTPTNTPSSSGSEPTATAVSQNNSTAIPTSTSTSATQPPTATTTPVGDPLQPTATATIGSIATTDSEELSKRDTAADSQGTDNATVEAAQKQEAETSLVESAASGASDLENSRIAAAASETNPDPKLKQDDTTEIGSIGSTNNQEETRNSDQNSNLQSNDKSDVRTGRIYLWGGFAAAILIFITAIYGSIVLFTRRKEN